MVQESFDWNVSDSVVECQWLYDRLNKEDIRIYDCTTYLRYTDDHPSKPYDVESGFEDYKGSHIPNAGFLDLQNNLSDNSSRYGMTLPKYEVLAESFKSLGVGDPYHVVLYARNGMQWATRIWAMLQAVGFTRTSILNGGFQEWERLNLPIEKSTNLFGKAYFKSRINVDLFVDKYKVMDALEKNMPLLLNALTRDIHDGDSTRYGRPGRIPGSVNVPFNELVDPSSGKFLPKAKILDIFEKVGSTPNSEIIHYCGGGIAATLTAFVLYQLGSASFQIYDDSLSEWAMDEKLPIEVGHAKS